MTYGKTVTPFIVISVTLSMQILNYPPSLDLLTLCHGHKTWKDFKEFQEFRHSTLKISADDICQASY
jgi:hypothetical protein